MNPLSTIIVIALSVALIVTGWRTRSEKDPTGFYPWQDPPGRFQLTDVKGWNNFHGIMWMVYGALIIVGWGLDFLFFNHVGRIGLAIIAAAIGGFGCLMIAHAFCERKYYKQPKKKR